MNTPLLKAGDVLGEWTLLTRTPGTKEPRTLAKWECRCSCGQVRTAIEQNLLRGTTKSCGHMRDAKSTDAMVLDALRVNGPMDRSRLNKLLGCSKNMADRALRRLRNLKDVRVHGWQRTSRSMARVYCIWDGQPDAIQPGRLPQVVYDRRYRARKRGEAVVYDSPPPANANPWSELMRST